MKNINIFLAMLFFFIMVTACDSPGTQGIIKHVAFGLYHDAPSQAEGTRHYYRHHAAGVLDKSEPWMRRYVSWQSHTPPEEAVERFGAIGGIYAELWWGSIEVYNTRQVTGPAGAPTRWGGSAGPVYTLHVPAVATEVFYDSNPSPEETSIIRWIQIIRYPEGVSLKKGEKWFLEVHAKEALKQPGLLKFISYSSVDDELDPRARGMGSRPEGESMPKSKPWVRINEYWYKNLDAWRKAVIESPPEYTVPPWGGEYPFVEMGSTFINYKWDADFIKGKFIIP